MSAGGVSLMGAVFARDFAAASRSGGGWFYALMFFAMFGALAGIAIGPELASLRPAAPAILWLAAAFASLLVAADIFEGDFRDGFLRAFAAEQESLAPYFAAKLLLIFAIAAAPMLAAAPIMLTMFGVAVDKLLGASLILALGLPAVILTAMFAAALAYNMDVSLDQIRQGLRTFGTTFFQTPGRMNIYDEHPFKVILDYAHNPAAVQAMCSLVDRFDVEGKRTVVLAAPGDRRDEDIQEIARIAAPHFDNFICRCDDNRRGRGEDEVAQLLKATLLEAGIDEDRIEIITSEEAATEHALRSAGVGDLLLILADNIKRSWKQIIYFDAEAEGGPGQAEAVTTMPLPDIEGFEMNSSLEIISDERGVRIAREQGD